MYNPGTLFIAVPEEPEPAPPTPNPNDIYELETSATALVPPASLYQLLGIGTPVYWVYVIALVPKIVGWIED